MPFALSKTLSNLLIGKQVRLYSYHNGRVEGFYMMPLFDPNIPENSTMWAGILRIKVDGKDQLAEIATYSVTEFEVMNEP